MRPTRFRFLALFLAASAITVYGLSCRSGRAGVQQVPAASPALTPAESLKTFSMPPGYHVELVASEPLVQDPDRDGLGHRGAHLGGRDARLRARPSTPPSRTSIRSAGSSCSRTPTATA